MFSNTIVNPNDNISLSNKLNDILSNFKSSYPQKRDNCGFINSELLHFLDKNTNFDVKIVRGNYNVDSLDLVDKYDLTRDQRTHCKQEFGNLNKDSVKEYIKQYLNEEDFYIYPHTYLRCENLILDAAFLMFKKYVNENTKERYIDDIINEAYLDDEEQFWDYKTETVDGRNIFDTKHTGTSFYDQFLGTTELDYLRDHENLVGKIVYMTPQEYYDICATKIFNTTSDRLKQERASDVHTIEHLKEVILRFKKKFTLPYINYAEKGQEGLHRMYVAGELFGWDDIKHPVLVIEHADPERFKRETQMKIDNDTRYRLQRAIKDSLEYEYIDESSWIDQLEWSLDREFKYSSYVETPVKFDLKSAQDKYIITIDNVSEEVLEDDIIFKEQDEKDDIDFDDDLSDEDIDFLTRYLGTDWDDEFPETKDKLLKGKLKENINHTLYDECKTGWTIETCHPSYRKKWSTDNPSAGQCAIRAMYI